MSVDGTRSPHRHADGHDTGLPQDGAGVEGEASHGAGNGGGVRRVELLSGCARADCTHVPLVTGGGPPSKGHPIFWWVNTVLGNIKNALHGTYHALRPKYLSGICPSLRPLQPSFRPGRARTPAYCRGSSYATPELSQLRMRDLGNQEPRCRREREYMRHKALTVACDHERLEPSGKTVPPTAFLNLLRARAGSCR